MAMSPVMVSGDGSSGMIGWDHRPALISSSKASCGSFEFSPWHDKEQRRACMSVAEDHFPRSGRIMPLTSPSPSAGRLQQQDSSDDDDYVVYNPRQETPNSFLVRSGSILGTLRLSPDADPEKEQLRVDARRKRADLEEQEEEEDADDEEEEHSCPRQLPRDEPETSSDDFFSSDADSTSISNRGFLTGSSRTSKRLTLGELINFGASSSSDNELQKQRLLESSSSPTVRNGSFMQWLQRSKSSGNKQDHEGQQQQKHKELKKDGMQGSRRGMERSMSSGSDRYQQQQQQGAPVTGRNKSDSLLVQALCGSKKSSDKSSVAVVNNATAPVDLRRSGSSRRPPVVPSLNRSAALPNHIFAAAIPSPRLQRSKARRSYSGAGEYVWTPSRSPLSSSDRSLQQLQQRNSSTKPYRNHQVPRSKSSGSTFFRSTSRGGNSASSLQLGGGGCVSRESLTKSRSTGAANVGFHRNNTTQLQQMPLLGKSTSRGGSGGNKVSSSSGRKSFNSTSLPGRPQSDSAVAMDRYNMESNKEELRRTSYLPYKRALLSFFPTNFLWPRRQQHASGAAAATLVSAPAHHHRCHYF